MRKYVVINDELTPKFSIGEIVAESYLSDEWYNSYAKLYYSLSSGEQQVMFEVDLEKL